MENKPIPSTVFSAIQNILAGIACSFYFIYKYYLSDDKIVKDLGASYPWFVMGWVIIMLISAGLSGSKIINFIITNAPALSKAISLIKKEVKDE